MAALFASQMMIGLTKTNGSIFNFESTMFNHTYSSSIHLLSAFDSCLHNITYTIERPVQSPLKSTLPVRSVEELLEEKGVRAVCACGVCGTLPAVEPGRNSSQSLDPTNVLL